VGGGGLGPGARKRARGAAVRRCFFRSLPAARLSRPNPIPWRRVRRSRPSLLGPPCVPCSRALRHTPGCCAKVEARDPVVVGRGECSAREVLRDEVRLPFLAERVHLRAEVAVPLGTRARQVEQPALRDHDRGEVAEPRGERVLPVELRLVVSEERRQPAGDAIVAGNEHREVVAPAPTLTRRRHFRVVLVEAVQRRRHHDDEEEPRGGERHGVGRRAVAERVHGGGEREPEGAVDERRREPEREAQHASFSRRSERVRGKQEHHGHPEQQQPARGDLARHDAAGADRLRKQQPERPVFPLLREQAEAEREDEQVCQIVALACEAPEISSRPISQWTGAEIAAEGMRRGMPDGC
jgi:hypothetical protein